MNNLKLQLGAVILGVGMAVLLLRAQQQKQPEKVLVDEPDMPIEQMMLNTINPRMDPCAGGTKVYKLPVGSDELIGLVYPPRLGPLHTNFEIPNPQDPCRGPFAEIYDNRVVYRCQPNV